MNITVPTALLRDMCRDAARAVPGKTALPILEHLLISAHAGTEECTLSVSASDQELAIRRTADIDPKSISDPGEICVPADMLLPFLDVCPGADIALRGDDNEVFVVSGQSNYRIMCLPPADFPAIDEPTNEGSSLHVGTEEFIGTVQSVLYAVATEAARPMLQGVLFEVHPDQLQFAATDTHRLASASLNLSCTPTPGNFIVPSGSLKHVLAILPRADGAAVRIDATESSMHFRSNGLSVRVRLLAGQYPPWRKILPVSDPTHLTVYVDAGVLEQSLKRAAILAKSAGKRIDMAVGAGKCTIKAETSGKGSMVEDVEAEVINAQEGFALGVSCGYMLDTCSVVDPSRRLRLEFESNIRPILIKIEDFDGFVGILMPLQPDLL